MLSDRAVTSKSDFQKPSANHGLITSALHIFSDAGISIFLSENASEIRIDKNLGKGRYESILPVFINIDLLIRLKISAPKSMFITVMRLNMIVRTFLLIWYVPLIF
ncbi:hypothetical protein Hanom_Chr16g01458491 [Helianthus anomalus]